MFVPLRGEAALKALDLEGNIIGREFDEQVRLAQVAVILWHLVFKNKVISECLPSQVRKCPMVLMSIVTIMREHNVGFKISETRREDGLDLLRFERKVSVRKRSEIYRGRTAAVEKMRRRVSSLLMSFGSTGGYEPVDSDISSARNESTDGSSTSNLYIIRMRADEQYTDGAIQIRKHIDHRAPIRVSSLFQTCQGASPLSNRSSRICFSLNVSMHAQKPSWW